MRTAPINSYQPQFTAKLPQKELNNLVDSALNHDKQAGIPKLYTLLERLDKMPGDKAELTSLLANNQSQLIGFIPRQYSTFQLRIDNKLVDEGSNIYDVLYSAVTSAKTKNGKKISMPKTVFDLMWWNNKEKDIKDVETLLRD